MATQNLSTQIQTFNFSPSISVRSTADENGSPWFFATDVCSALEIGNSRQAISRLDDDEKGVTTNDTLGGKQEMTIINESGLYSLILTSRKAEAKKFKKWVTSEVLPALRKNGKYEVGQPETVALPEPAAESRVLLTLRAGQVISAEPVPPGAIVATATHIAQLAKLNGYILAKPMTAEFTLGRV